MGYGSYNIRNGIQFGVLIGLFFGAGIGPVMYGTEMRIAATEHLVDAIFWVVNYAVTGMVTSFVYKK